MTRVGFIGLGIMSSPMAANLVGAGHRVTGYDLDAGAVRDADVVITMLPDHPQVETVVLGADGVFEHARPGALLIDMSTIRPETSVVIAEAGAAQGIRVLDVPVSGGQAGPVQASLSIMVGGGETDFARCLANAGALVHRTAARIAADWLPARTAT